MSNSDPNDEEQRMQSKRRMLVKAGLGGTAFGFGLGKAGEVMAASAVVFGMKPEDVWGDAKALQLVHAAVRGDATQVETLVKGGVPVDVKGKNDWTPLAWVTVVGNLAGMRKLLEHGADANSRVIGDKVGTLNPLVMMVAQRHDAVRLELLLKHGLNPNSRWGWRKESGYEGSSLLMESVMSKRCVELLVEHGADVNFKTEIGGVTALVDAITVGQLDVASYLLERGATANLDRAANNLQNRFLSDEPKRIALLKVLKAKGAKILPSKMYPNTPIELLSA
jgi:ankyrin repeat protein